MPGELSPQSPAQSAADSRNWKSCFPLLQVRAVAKANWSTIPSLAEFQSVSHDEKLIKSYHIRVERPKFPWILLVVALVFFNLRYALYSPIIADTLDRNDLSQLISWQLDLPWIVCLTLPFVLVLFYHFGRERGHTILYLTNQRVVVLELTRGFLRKRQTVLNYSLGNVSGFTLYAQRGLKWFLNFILLKEKRAFYLCIVTRTTDSLRLGAVTSRGSRFDPGRDAVSLCGELDSQVLALKRGR